MVSKEKKRPLVLLGHSMGGIVVVGVSEPSRV